MISPKIIVFLTDSDWNYGKTLSVFISRFPEIYVLLKSPSFQADLSNKNSFSKIKWYMDGTEILIQKHLFSTFLVEIQEHFVPGSKIIVPGQRFIPSNPNQKYIIKPSSIFIGDGRNILVGWGSDLHVQFRPSKIPYIAQPFLPRVTTWKGNRWDCRHYGMLIFSKSTQTLAGYTFKRAIARRAVVPYDEHTVDPASHLTNISVAQTRMDLLRLNLDLTLTELSHSSSKYLNDSAGKILKDLSVHIAEKIDRKESAFMFLGFDSIFWFSKQANTELPPSSPSIANLIKRGELLHAFLEVNQEPSPVLSSSFKWFVELYAKIWDDICEFIFPWILRGGKLPLIESGRLAFSLKLE